MRTMQLVATLDKIYYASFSTFTERTAFLLQGRGSYEDRTDMLHLIVDLVEASIFADNQEWRLW